MRSLLLLSFLSFSGLAHAQYPSQSTLLADVKKQSPDEFVTITPEGSWSMFHDKVPDWQAPDACRHQVNIVGKKRQMVLSGRIPVWPFMPKRAIPLYSTACF